MVSDCLQMPLPPRRPPPLVMLDNFSHIMSHIPLLQAVYAILPLPAVFPQASTETTSSSAKTNVARALQEHG